MFDGIVNPKRLFTEVFSHQTGHGKHLLALCTRSIAFQPLIRNQKSLLVIGFYEVDLIIENAFRWAYYLVSYVSVSVLSVPLFI